MRWKIIEKNKFVGWGWLKEKLSFFSSQIIMLGATTRNFNPPLGPETSVLTAILGLPFLMIIFVPSVFTPWSTVFLLLFDGKRTKCFLVLAIFLACFC